MELSRARGSEEVVEVKEEKTTTIVTHNARPSRALWTDWDSPNLAEELVDRIWDMVRDWLRDREACLRIVDVRGIMGRACAKQWGAHVQSNCLRMCKAMACAWRWLYLLANTSAPLKDQSLMLSLSCMDMVSPDKLSRLLLSMSTIRKHASRNSHGARDWDLSYG